jgi:cysteine desulfurase
VALQAANHETGVLQAIAETAAFAAGHGLAMLVDAAQAAGRMAIEFSGLGADYLVLSGHKLGGPKGTGALVLREGAPLAPLLRGGGQERRRRAGTECVAAIAGFGAAARAARNELAAAAARMARLRDRLEAGLLELTPEAAIIGRSSPRLPNTACVALPGRLAEVLVAALDLGGIAVSAGAACSSGKVSESPVLAAMGLAPAVRAGAIRVSLGPTTSEADIAAFLAAWSNLPALRRHAA